MQIKMLVLSRNNQRWSRGHKAREHEKIRGQGQKHTFRGSTLSRPRTEMLKAKDQGYYVEVFSENKKQKKGLRSKYSQIFRKIQAFPKKKGLQKFFLASSLACS